MSPPWGVSFYLGRLGPGETSPVTWILKGKRIIVQRTNFPLHRLPPNQIVPAKQPIIEYNQRKEKHLLETTQQGD
jgi:hypothetical protein